MKKNSETETSKRVAITDAEFVRRLESHSGNYSALGRELGISHTAVRKRFARIKKGARQKGAQNGETATVVLLKETRRGFPEGVQSTMQKVGALSRLEGLLEHIEANVQKIAEKLEGSERPNLAYIKTLTGLIREARGLITDSFSIKKDLFNIQSTATFIDSVVSVMEEYDPDVQAKIYQELSSLGREDQLLVNQVKPKPINLK